MRQLWARSVAAGVPDELFWEIVPTELVELFVAARDVNAARYGGAGGGATSGGTRGPALTGHTLEAWMVKTGRKRKAAA